MIDVKGKYHVELFVKIPYAYREPAIEVWIWHERNHLDHALGMF